MLVPTAGRLLSVMDGSACWCMRGGTTGRPGSCAEAAAGEGAAVSVDVLNLRQVPAGSARMSNKGDRRTRPWPVACFSRAVPPGDHERQASAGCVC